MEIAAFALFSISTFVFIIYAHYRDNIKKWRLVDEEKILLRKYELSNFDRKKKKRLAHSFRVAPNVIFIRLSTVDLHHAIEEYIYKTYPLYMLNFRDRKLFFKTVADTCYTEKGETHTLREWEIISTCTVESATIINS